jgi:hypothetical protein
MSRMREFIRSDEGPVGALSRGSHGNIAPASPQYYDPDQRTTGP